MSDTMRRRLGVTACAAVLLGALGVLASAVPAHAKTDADGLVAAGTLDVGTSERFAVDTTTRTLLSIRGESTLPLSVAVHDPARAKTLRRAEFPGYLNQGVSGGKPTVYSFDETARRLYVVAYHTLAEQLSSTNPYLVTIDVDRLALVQERPLAPIFPPGVRVFGMRASTTPDRLMLVGQVVAGAAGIDAPRAFGVFVAEVSAAQAAATGAPLATWGPQTVRGCQAVISSQSQAIVARDGNTIFIGCATSSAAFFPLPGVPAVVAVPADTPADPSISFLPGSYATGDMYYDAIARRLLLVGSAAGRPAQAVWVYDVEHRVFLGQVAAGDLNVLAAGVDETTGRLYVGISDTEGNGAILVSSDRGLDLAQAIPFDARPIFGVIVATPFDDTILVPEQPREGLPRFRIYRDRIPETLIAPGQPPDYGALDGRTTQQAQFSVDAQAFGLRVHEMGGVNGLAQNVFPNGNLNYWQNPGTITGLRDGDRDATFSHVSAARLSETDASASAFRANADESTDDDHTTLSGAPLSSADAACSDFGDGSAPAHRDGARAECNLAGARVDAGADDPGNGVAGVVSVAESSASASLTRVATTTNAVVHAEARHVVLGSGLARIGFVAADATVRAGRSSASSYSRTFRDVEAGSFRCEDQCDAAKVLAALGETLGSQFRVEMPLADVLVTPEGTHAHAFRDAWQHQEDVAVNNQPVTDRTVPALRVAYIGDNAAASRLIVDVAGVKADATDFRRVHVDPPPLPTPLPFDSGGALPQPSAVAQPEPVPAQFASRTLTSPGRDARLLFGGGIGHLARTAALWAVFLAPAVLFSRRRAYVHTVEDVD